MGRGLNEESMTKISEEIKQLKERLHFFEQLAVMGKLILCAAHELKSHLEEIEGFLLDLQNRENDHAKREQNLTEALKGLGKMSLTISSLLSNTKLFSTSSLPNF